MNKNEIYFSRLLAFADFIVSLEQPSEINLKIAEIRDIGKPIIYTFYDLSVFELLPDCFNNWFLECRTGNPIIEGYDDSGIGTIDSVFQFFGLTKCQEFTHLFDISARGQMCEVYGGVMLNRKSTLKNYAQNIVEFVKAIRI